MGLPLRCGDASNLGERLSPTSRKHQAWQFKGWSWLRHSSHCQTRSGILLLCVEPIQGCQKCDRVHRYTRGIVGLSHQSSDLSHLCNPLQNVVIHASLDTRFKGMQVVTYLTNVKQLRSYWLKSSQKGLGTCIWINKAHSSFWLYSALWEALI